MLSQAISTHTSLAGGDDDHLLLGQYHIISTHTSLAGGDFPAKRSPIFSKISTHTSLAGGDDQFGLEASLDTNFNPHLPRGRRQL